MFWSKKQNMAALLPKLSDVQIQTLCNTMNLNRGELTLTDRNVVIARLRKVECYTDIYDAIFPVWKQFLRLWLRMSLVASGILFVAFSIAVIVFLANTVHWAILLLLAPYGTALVAGFYMFLVRTC